MPRELKFSVERIQENCEPALCTVLFMGGAGGAARRCHRQSGAADAFGQGRPDPGHQRRRAGLCLARRRHHLHGRCHADAGGAFGYVPTPALVAPIEFTLRLSDYAALGGHMDYVRPLASLKDKAELRPMPYMPGRRA